MNQSERRMYLIKELLNESPRYRDMAVPADSMDQRRLLRSLMNVRMPAPVSEEFLSVQDEYLRTVTAEKGITKLSELKPVEKDIYVWQGDITTLECGAVVNAANSQMLGCFQPLHSCIDNAIPYLITHRPITSFKASA